VTTPPSSLASWRRQLPPTSTVNWLGPRRCRSGGLFDQVAWLTGRHRIQRVPPNDKKGRRQSSEVTVVALGIPARVPQLNKADVRIETSRGTGPGGQHRNKTESKVTVTHLPTGLSAAVDSRSQHSNKQQALATLAARVAAHQSDQHEEAVNYNRRSQAGGERAFTWTEWRDSVVNHRTGRKGKMSIVLKGRFDAIK
jgi:peptide chain release factor 1